MWAKLYACSHTRLDPDKTFQTRSAAQCSILPMCLNMYSRARRSGCWPCLSDGHTGDQQRPTHVHSQMKHLMIWPQMAVLFWAADLIRFRGLFLADVLGCHPVQLSPLFLPSVEDYEDFSWYSSDVKGVVHQKLNVCSPLCDLQPIWLTYKRKYAAECRAAWIKVKLVIWFRDYQIETIFSNLQYVVNKKEALKG